MSDLEGRVAVLLRDGDDPGSKRWQTIALFFCGFALTLNLLFMIRLDTRQERFLDYGQFKGEYISDRTALLRQLEIIQNELATEQAWKSSIKTDLGELLAIVQDQQIQKIVRRMIEER